jgi:hypothetical protein
MRKSASWSSVLMKIHHQGAIVDVVPDEMKPNVDVFATIM